MGTFTVFLDIALGLERASPRRTPGARRSRFGLLVGCGDRRVRLDGVRGAHGTAPRRGLGSTGIRRVVTRMSGIEHWKECSIPRRIAVLVIPRQGWRFDRSGRTATVSLSATGDAPRAESCRSLECQKVTSPDGPYRSRAGADSLHLSQCECTRAHWAPVSAGAGGSRRAGSGRRRPRPRPGGSEIGG